MNHSSTVYFVESEFNGNRRIVVHTPGTKYHKFLDGKKATKFRDELKRANPQKKFRRVKETTTYSEGEWI